MVSKVLAYTTIIPDGVISFKFPNFCNIGLNGRQHLIDDDGELMKFDTIEDAKDFITDVGEDPEDAYIDYSELDEDDVEHDLYHDGSRIENINAS